MSILVLDQMQVLDQEITLPRARAEQRAHLLERLRIDLPALWGAPRATPAGGRLANCATI
jgi:7,8-dihydro-6-hydroxymethylpterin-pyrophosphokinase